jgi:hypothetical protein
MHAHERWRPHVRMRGRLHRTGVRGRCVRAEPVSKRRDVYEDERWWLRLRVRGWVRGRELRDRPVHAESVSSGRRLHANNIGRELCGELFSELRRRRRVRDRLRVSFEGLHEQSVRMRERRGLRCVDSR